MMMEPEYVLVIDFDAGLYQRYYINYNEWTIEKSIKKDILDKFIDESMTNCLMSQLDFGVESV